MKICAYITNRVMWTWPADYWRELFHKLTKRGHEVYVISDDPEVVVNDTNPKVFNCTGKAATEADEVVSSCDMYVGVPTRWYELAGFLGKNRIALCGPRIVEDGIVADTPCAGCIDKLGVRTDCNWGDELCYRQITPNDVMGAIAPCE